MGQEASRPMRDSNTLKTFLNPRQEKAWFAYINLFMRQLLVSLRYSTRGKENYIALDKMISFVFEDEDRQRKGKTLHKF